MDLVCCIHIQKARLAPTRHKCRTSFQMSLSIMPGRVFKQGMVIKLYSVMKIIHAVTSTISLVDALKFQLMDSLLVGRIS